MVLGNLVITSFSKINDITSLLKINVITSLRVRVVPGG